MTAVFIGLFVLFCIALVALGRVAWAFLNVVAALAVLLALLAAPFVALFHGIRGGANLVRRARGLRPGSKRERMEREATDERD